MLLAFDWTPDRSVSWTCGKALLELTHERFEKRSAASAAMSKGDLSYLYEALVF